MSLSLEERNDLRKRVLSGYSLTLEEAREVIASYRTGQAVAAISAAEAKPKRGKKAGISDSDLDSQLSGLGL